MTPLLSFFHMFFVALGVGGGFINLLLALWLRDKRPEMKSAVGPFMARVVRISFFCLIGLWISGIMLGREIYGDFQAMPLGFWAKIAAVTALTLLSGGTQLVRIGALPASLMATSGRRFGVSVTATTLSVIILIFAAIAFG